jgi:hypothetical protein
MAAAARGKATAAKKWEAPDFTSGVDAQRSISETRNARFRKRTGAK